MQTKRLIELLNEVDPSGEAECCVDGIDIGVVMGLHGYYDGAYQVLKRDPDGRIVGAKISKRGFKVVIQPISIEDWLVDDIALKVEYEGLAEQQKEYEARVANWRTDAIRIHMEVDGTKKL